MNVEEKRGLNPTLLRQAPVAPLYLNTNSKDIHWFRNFSFSRLNKRFCSSLLSSKIDSAGFVDHGLTARSSCLGCPQSFSCAQIKLEGSI